VKIAWFGHTPSPRGNGLVTYSRELVAGLRRREHSVAFFYHDTRERAQAREEADIHLASFNLFDRASISLPSAERKIHEIFSREQMDVAHVSLSFSQLDGRLPALCHAHNIPAIATLHYPFGPRGTLWGDAVRWLYRANTRAFARYDAIIVFAENQRALLEEFGMPRARVRVLPNGVDTATFAPGASDYKAQIGAALVVTFIGRLDPEKNVGALADAFQQLNLPADHKLVIVGNGSDLARLRAKFQRDPRIIFTGYIGDRAERIRILQAADIFVLPSAIEGLSLALLEAMATGNAVIATDVGADAEVLRGAGIVIDLNNLRAQLPLALRVLIEYPAFRRELATRARQRAVEQYALETNIDRVVELYRELAKRKT
jgi:glycosyltransferase involved in cell wall biosynthesis